MSGKGGGKSKDSGSKGKGGGKSGGKGITWGEMPKRSKGPTPPDDPHPDPGTFGSIDSILAGSNNDKGKK